MEHVESDAEIYGILKDAEGPELMRRIATILAAQERKIEELTSSLQLLKLYEKHSAALNGALQSRQPKPQENDTPSYASTYVVAASDYLLEADGFHSLEHSGDALAFRWAAKSGTMKFAFYVDRRTPLDLELIFFSAVDRENFEKMRLTEGDYEHTIVQSLGPGMVKLTAVLPPSQTAIETILTIHVPHVQRLGEDDGRIAGVAFHRLSVSPQVSQE